MSSSPRDKVSRDLDAARTAFAANDAAASARAHDVALTQGASEGGHANSSNDAASAIREEVLSALWMGLTTSLLLISALSLPGSSIRYTSLLTVCTVYAFSGGIIWAVNSRLAHHIKAEVYKRERKRESWELRNYKEGEVREIIELYEERGMSRKDAEAVVLRMSNYHEFFVDVMMAEELALVKPIPHSQTPWRFVYSGTSFFSSAVLPIFLSVGSCMLLELFAVVTQKSKTLAPPLHFFPIVCVYGIVGAVGIAYQNSLANRLQSSSHIAVYVLISTMCLGLPQISFFILKHFPLSHDDAGSKITAGFDL